MATTFGVIYLGTFADLDPTEGNSTTEDAALLVGTTFGSLGAPLSNNIRTLSPVGSPGSVYNNGGGSGDQYSIDGTTYTHDGFADYTARVTFADGTTAEVPVNIFQTTTGELFLAPNTTGEESIQALMDSQPITSLEILTMDNNTSDFTVDRLASNYADSTVDGTSGDDNMQLGYTDADGTAITSGDDTITGGDGNDTISGGDGGDLIVGDGGDDSIEGGSGADTIYGDGGEAFVFNTQAGDLFVYDPVTGTTTQLISGLLTYGDIATTPDGTLYGVVLDANDGGTNAAIYEIDPATGTETLVYDLPDGFEWFNGFASDADGNLYYTDSTNFNVTRIEPDGVGGFTNPTIVYTYSGGITEMTDIAFLQDGTVLVVTEPADVKSFDLDGSGNFINETSLGAISGAADLTGILQGPDGLVYATDINGAVYSTDPSVVPLSWVTEPSTGQANVYGIAAVPSGVGSAGNDDIDGGTGDDTIVAGEGSDTIRLSDGFGNDDIYAGEDPDGLDTDVLDASGVTAGGVTVTSTDENGTLSQGANSASFSDVESFILTDQDDSFTAFGTDGVTVDGGGGNDTIQEGHGDNSLSGGDGDDIFETGFGTSTIDGGAGTDTLSVVQADDAISVTFDGTGSGTYDDLTDSDSGTFTSIEAVQGSSGADSIDAAADGGGVDLSGGAGNDTIAGGSGSDNLDGGDGRDLVVFAGNHDDYTYDITGPDQITVTHIATGVVDTVSAFEEIQFADGRFDLVIGTDGGESLFHDGPGIGQDADLIIGGDGADYLNSGDDDDILFGGAGNDTILPGPGADTIYAGDGDDLVWLSSDDSADGGAGTDTLDAQFGSFGDTISFIDATGGVTDNGTTFDNFEAFVSGDGADSYDASLATGDLSIQTGADNDTIIGGSGNDTLDGGTGADLLTGGAGADVFVAGGDADTITDFDTTTGIGNGDSTDNDFVDLTSYYNQTNLDAWNLANPGQTYATPLGWLRADQADNGVMDEAGGLLIQDSGAPVAANELNAENTGVVCFASGTLIDTPSGLIPIEHLKVGDIVNSRDNGPQQIVWAGCKELTSDTLARFPELNPIWLSARFFGLEEDLVVSPQHGVLLRLPERGGTEQLFRATHLADLQGGGARRMRGCKHVTYHHLMFETHQIIRANGFWSESLYPGKMALSSLHADSLQEVLTIFPELQTHVVEDAYGLPSAHYSKRRDLPNCLRELR